MRTAALIYNASWEMVYKVLKTVVNTRQVCWVALIFSQNFAQVKFEKLNLDLTTWLDADGDRVSKSVVRSRVRHWPGCFPGVHVADFVCILADFECTSE